LIKSNVFIFKIENLIFNKSTLIFFASLLGDVRSS